MTIHKEGYTTIAIVALLLLLLNAAFQNFLGELTFVTQPLLLISIVFFGLVVYFFRSPKIEVVQNDAYVLSPADGKVVAIEEMKDEEYFKDRRIQVSVFMSPLNVHLNRYPISGTVKYFRHHNGHFHVAWHPKSSVENEHTTTVLKHQNGAEVLFKQIAGAVARRIVSYARESEQIVQGTQCGFIKFGSRVDVLLPVGTEVDVKIGDKVKCGKTVLARFHS